MRYLRATQGTPPDFAKYQNHKAYYIAQSGEQMCDDYGCTPAPQGGFVYVDNDCIIYEIDGPVKKLNDIVAGHWSLSTN